MATHYRSSRFASAPGDLRDVRSQAAIIANSDDAAVWRWFSSLMDDRRVRWCHATDRWFVSVDNRHVATEPSFDSAIRAAKEAVERREEHDAAG
ncbi:hypothetical protein LGM65_31050 [Burkholderia anthina]|uniref:hypothetical protein n=1 Tax=Burkholderia anthina TaxID=179879 RepID=UPI001CF24F3D|nr:hypothetical protein [Burkholderia anthina]MCA8095259.1 hypothetical protein [Burkholderia anthina]